MAKFGKRIMMSERNYSGSGIFSRINFSGKFYLALSLLLVWLVVQIILGLAYFYEYRNDLRNNALLRETAADSIKFLRDSSREMLERFKQNGLSGTPDLSSHLEEIKQALNDLKNGPEGNISLNRIEAIDAVLAEFTELTSAPTTATYQLMADWYDRYSVAIADLENELEKHYQLNYQEILTFLLIRFAIVFLILILVVLGCKWLIMCAFRSVDEPAERMIRCLQGADGDLQVKIPIAASEGLGSTGLILNDGIAKYRELAFEFKNAGNKLNYLVDELASGFSQIFLWEVQLQEVYREIEANINNQKQMGERVNEEIERIISGLSNLQNLPGKVSRIAEELNSLLTVTKEYLGGILDRQVEVKDESHDVVNFLRDLSATSGRVDRIMKELVEIEEESEMLAFNSAISAARAGVEGQGFSVVAKEIANLVERSKKASTTLSELIGQIQTKVEEIVGSIPKDELTGVGGLPLDQTINSLCFKLNDTAFQCLQGLDQMRRVMETIYAKSNETFEAIHLAAKTFSRENDIFNEIKNTMARYLESVKYTGEIVDRLLGAVNNLQSATDHLIGRNQ
ncbi:MAG: methyl-accepting chemotaxis protein [Firmicutes bacterium]|nr:methyl-accepting chemotaxis protein [Bacillota bacterium]